MCIVDVDPLHTLSVAVTSNSQGSTTRPYDFALGVNLQRPQGHTRASINTKVNI